MLPSEFYSTLAEDVGRVLVTGPVATARLAAIPNAWETEEAVDEESEALLPAPLRTPAQRPANMGDWIMAKEQAARAPFEPYWAEILGRVKTGEFLTQRQLATAYRKPAAWASQFKKVALAQQALTKEAWDAIFIGSKGNRAEKRNKSANTPTTNI